MIIFLPSSLYARPPLLNRKNSSKDALYFFFFTDRIFKKKIYRPSCVSICLWKSVWHQRKFWFQIRAIKNISKVIFVNRKSGIDWRATSCKIRQLAKTKQFNEKAGWKNREVLTFTLLGFPLFILECSNTNRKKKIWTCVERFRAVLENRSEMYNFYWIVLTEKENMKMLV